MVSIRNYIDRICFHNDTICLQLDTPTGYTEMSEVQFTRLAKKPNRADLVETPASIGHSLFCFDTRGVV
jgi:hypothetical protein